MLQDIAVVVPEDVPAAESRTRCAQGGGELLERLGLFDVYRGEQVGEGSKSLALRLEFRAPDRTLTDEEVAERRARIEAGSRRSEGSSVARRHARGGGRRLRLRGRALRALVDRHPPLELTVVTARTDAGRAPRRLYPRYAVAARLEEFDADRVAERARRRARRLPARGGRADGRGSCASAG